MPAVFIATALAVCWAGREVVHARRASFWAESSRLLCCELDADRAHICDWANTVIQLKSDLAIVRLRRDRWRARYEAAAAKLAHIATVLEREEAA